MMLQLKVGQKINAPFLPVPAEIKKFESRAGYFLLEVVLQDNANTYKSLRITQEQSDSIEPVSPAALTPVGEAEDFFLFIEANRIRLAHQFDPQLAVSISQVDPLPHQIEAVYHYVLPSPKIRFLIADDPGAGKTIMAGLVLKELQYRGLARRVLIVAPGHLKYQWQREMKERFLTSFVVIDRGRIDSSWGENVWEESNTCITSIDFAKQDNVRATLVGTHWDLVIVDEAHKMSAYAYETKRGVKINKTRRYQLGETLSRSTDHMLFLTATPHRGDDENFRLFLDLLRPGFFAQTELLHESVESRDNPVFIRRLKEDMRRFDGRPIFPPRHIQSVKFRLTPAELDLYNAVTRYVQNYYDKARENRSISFAMMILQRRLTSSSNAIYRSLERRLERLQELLDLPERIRQENQDYMRVRHLSAEELEDMSEEERNQVEERLEHLTIARNIKEVKIEVEQVERLLEQAGRVRTQENESKLNHLRDQVLANLDGRKLIIFTEFRDTLDFLVEKLQNWGFTVGTIHGAMNMDARIEAEEAFRHQNQIMVATEAAGEGINLQFCSLMVNYDIPWNPNRLEQRMGRIHRYGQDREVFIWNMISRDTREGQILDRIFEKLDRMRLALGSDRVFDIIGDIIPGGRLDELIRDAIFNQRRMEEIEWQIEAVDETSVRQTLEQVFMSGLATRHIDISTLQQETLQAQENRLVPEYVEDYFKRAFGRLGGSLKQENDGLLGIRTVPFDLRHWGDDYAFKTTYGRVGREYRRMTFDKRVAQANSQATFIAPGHPLLEAVNESILQHRWDGQYAVFCDPEGAREGVLWFITGEVLDGAGRAAGKRVFCLYHDAAAGSIQTVNPAILWDHQPLQDADIPPALESLIRERERVEDHMVTQVLLP
ncbi:MAG: DEAD/DEAH box helicase family protein, partial [Anaerolineales bacterium]|nr:DEAD/DEAH box helicase family protein [Anaerolineales bacterium]